LKNFVHASDAMVLVVLALMMQDEMEGLRKGNESAPESSNENSAQVDALIEQLIEPTIERMDRLAKRLEIL
jgi:cell division protein ZapA (FtsZ GTPase activity inhibitor)